MDEIQKIDDKLSDIMAIIDEIEAICPKGMKITFDECHSSNSEGIYRSKLSLDVIYPRD